MQLLDLLIFISAEAKYEVTLKRGYGGIYLSEIEVFGKEKGVIRMYVIYKISDCK